MKNKNLLVLFVLLIAVLAASYAWSKPSVRTNVERAIGAQVVWSGSFPSGLTIVNDGEIVRNADIQNGLVIKASHIIVEDSKIHNAQGHGWIATSSKGQAIEDITVRNSYIYDNAKGTCYPGCSGGWQSGGKVQSYSDAYPVHNVHIYGNHIYQNYGEGLGLRGYDIVVENNIFWDNFSFDIYWNSWDVVVRNNFVYHTGDSKFDRNGYPAACMGGQEEGFANWPKSAHDWQVYNNICYKGKYGFRYGGGGGGPTPGLVNAVIAYNTYVQTVNAEISVAFAPAQNNVLVTSNIAKRISVTNTNLIARNNADVTLAGGFDPSNFVPASAPRGEVIQNISTDFFGKSRTSYTIGAVELGSISITPTPATPTNTSVPGTATFTPLPVTQTPTISTITITPSPTITPSVTPTKLCYKVIVGDQTIGQFCPTP